MVAEIDCTMSSEALSNADWVDVRATSATSRRGVLGDRPARARRIEFGFRGGIFGIDLAGEPAAWVMPTIRSVQELLTLPQGWDSYGASRIDPHLVDAALELLLLVMRDDTPCPAVVPTSAGGIQLEWHTRGVDLEVEFLSPSRIRGAFEDLRTGDDWEADLSVDVERLSDAISRLSRLA